MISSDLSPLDWFEDNVGLAGVLSRAASEAKTVPGFIDELQSISFALPEKATNIAVKDYRSDCRHVSRQRSTFEHNVTVHLADTNCYI